MRAAVPQIIIGSQRGAPHAILRLALKGFAGFENVACQTASAVARTLRRSSTGMESQRATLAYS